MAQTPGAPRDPRQPVGNAEYRRKQAERERRRKKRRQQQLIVLGAIALAIVLLVVCIVLVFKSIFKKSDDTSTPESGISTSQDAEGLVTWPTASDRSAWNLWLVNEQNPVDGEYVLENQATYAQNGVAYYFDDRIVEALASMIEDCNAAVEGHSLRVVSGYRSVKYQTELFERYVNNFRGEGKSDEEAYRLARELTSAPQVSEHHTGLAVDFIAGDMTEPGERFADTSEYNWLQNNSANYGFILRYPGSKESITGVAYNPYHFRYVGVDDAHAITNAGICLEEYLAVRPATSGDSGGQEDEGSGLPEDGGSEPEE